jgi:hypothetical protein
MWWLLQTHGFPVADGIHLSSFQAILLSAVGISFLLLAGAF